MARRPVLNPSLFSLPTSPGPCCARASTIFFAAACMLPVLSLRGDDFVLGCDDHAGSPVDRIDTRREYTRTIAVTFSDTEIDWRPSLRANPVALHGQNALRPPPFELRDVLQEFISIGGGSQEPLLERSLLDRSGLMPPAATLDHLLVGEDGGSRGGTS